MRFTASAFILLFSFASPVFAADLYECQTLSDSAEIMISRARILVNKTGITAEVNYRGNARPWLSVRDSADADFKLEFANTRGDYHLIHFSNPNESRYAFTINYGVLESALTQETQAGEHTVLLDLVYMDCQLSVVEDGSRN